MSPAACGFYIAESGAGVTPEHIVHSIADPQLRQGMLGALAAQASAPAPSGPAPGDAIKRAYADYFAAEGVEAAIFPTSPEVAYPIPADVVAGGTGTMPGDPQHPARRATPACLEALDPRRPDRVRPAVGLEARPRPPAPTGGCWRSGGRSKRCCRPWRRRPLQTWKPAVVNAGPLDGLRAGSRFNGGRAPTPRWSSAARCRRTGRRRPGWRPAGVGVGDVPNEDVDRHTCPSARRP